MSGSYSWISGDLTSEALYLGGLFGLSPLFTYSAISDTRTKINKMQYKKQFTYIDLNKIT